VVASDGGSCGGENRLPAYGRVQRGLVQLVVHFDKQLSFSGRDEGMMGCGKTALLELPEVV